MLTPQVVAATAFANTLYETDITSAPSYRVTVLMKDALVKRGVPMILACRIITAMKIQCTSDFVKDITATFMIVNAMADTILRLMKEFDKDFDGNSEIMILNMAPKFSLEF